MSRERRERRAKAHNYRDLAACAMPYIRQRPGLTAERLCVCLGWNPYSEYEGKDKTRRKFNESMAKLLRCMEFEKLIRVEQVGRFADFKLYPADWTPPPRLPYCPPPVTVSRLW